MTYDWYWWCEPRHSKTIYEELTEFLSSLPEQNSGYQRLVPAICVLVTHFRGMFYRKFLTEPVQSSIFSKSISEEEISDTVYLLFSCDDVQTAVFEMSRNTFSLSNVILHRLGKTLYQEGEFETPYSYHFCGFKNVVVQTLKCQGSIFLSHRWPFTLALPVNTMPKGFCARVCTIFKSSGGGRTSKSLPWTVKPGFLFRKRIGESLPSFLSSSSEAFLLKLRPRLLVLPIKKPYS